MESSEKNVRRLARGQILRITRIAFNFEQSEMASILGLSKSSVSLIECGRRGFSFNVLDNYLTIFKVDKESFKGLEDKIANFVLKGETDKLEIVEWVYEMLLKANSL